MYTFSQKPTGSVREGVFCYLLIQDDMKIYTSKSLFSKISVIFTQQTEHVCQRLIDFEEKQRCKKSVLIP